MTRRSGLPPASRTVPRAVALGRWLFRYRSLTPVPLIGALLIWLLWSRQTGRGLDPRVELALDWLALILLSLGELLRLVVVGRAPAGTSGRGRQLEARVLVTWGAYAWTRNPLYFGNLLLCLGLLVEIRSGVAALGALLFFYLQYARVIDAEEAYLRDRFGQAYDEWSTRTPRFWPRPPGRSSRALGDGGSGRWRSIRWRAAILQDADTWFAAFGSRALWRWWLERPPLSGAGSAGSAFLALTGLYLGVKVTRKLGKRRKAGV